MKIAKIVCHPVIAVNLRLVAEVGAAGKGMDGYRKASRVMEAVDKVLLPDDTVWANPFGRYSPKQVEEMKSKESEGGPRLDPDARVELGFYLDDVDFLKTALEALAKKEDVRINPVLLVKIEESLLGAEKVEVSLKPVAAE